jgi:hypothetical protein
MSFQLWKTRFKYIGDDKHYNIFNDHWVVTDFVRRFGDEELFYIIQPVIEEDGKIVGATGLHAYIVNKEELFNIFEMIDPPNDNSRSLKILEDCREKLANMSDEELIESMKKVGIVE